MSPRRGGRRLTAFEYRHELAEAFETLGYRARLLVPYRDIGERKAPMLILAVDLDHRKRTALALLVQDVTQHELTRDRFLLVTKRYRDLYLRQLISVRSKKQHDLLALKYGSAYMSTREYSLAKYVLNIDWARRTADTFPTDENRKSLSDLISSAVESLKLEG